MTTIDAVEVTGVGELGGTTRVPGDKSIAHRALIIATLADGTSEVRGLPHGDDVHRTRIALAALGAYFDGDSVIGGRDRLHAARHPLEAGNSGTMARLFLGLAASLPFATELDGDPSVRSRPMDRVIEPLRQMGARIDCESGARLPVVVGGAELTGIDYSTPVASAQVKGALLLAGIGAAGTTTVHEKFATRRHTEELLAQSGASMTIDEQPGDYLVRVERSDLVPINVRVPGDPSQAAFVVVAASIVERADIRLEGVYIGKERLGFVAALLRMGARIEVVPRDEMTGDLLVKAASLHATEIGGDEVPSLIDELPVLVVAACFAEGTTTIRDAAELRLKESDRITVMTKELRSLGARISELPDGFVIEGGGFCPQGQVSSNGDHRVAMALAVAALGGKDAVRIDGFSATETSWPGFLDDLRRLTCR